eukprot:TRINITY_DN25846_c0_g1_i1.p1 TRINITY_DN25846_c0_g1~~TRINITY_DN25846_c0_g1_i1.p1  ORF type:complete len:151 (+),score=18.56 TRINITY_DN25846_c0_g1_i1:277-729(+)
MDSTDDTGGSSQQALAQTVVSLNQTAKESHNIAASSVYELNKGWVAGITNVSRIPQVDSLPRVPPPIKKLTTKPNNVDVAILLNSPCFKDALQRIKEKKPELDIVDTDRLNKTVARGIRRMKIRASIEEKKREEQEMNKTRKHMEASLRG